MNGSAKKAVGGTRPWTSRATHRKPAAVSGGMRSTISFTAGSSPSSLPERDHQQVDAEIADRRPVIIVILLQPGRMVEVELDPVAAHVAEQVDQRRHRRIEQRHHRREHDEREAQRAIPTRGAPSSATWTAGAASTPIVTACNRLARARPSGVQPIVHARAVSGRCGIRQGRPRTAPHRLQVPDQPLVEGPID